MSFVGLHIHSDYSLLDGASQLPQLIDRAVELGMPAIALTDHGVMYGAIQLIKLCRNKNIKPIIGNEMYVINGDIEKQQRGKKFHQVVLAKNTQGYKNLVKLTTLSHLHGFQGKGIFARPCINKELLEKYHEGLIVTSGCLAGEVPQNIMQGKYEEAKKIAKWYKDLFGEDYYLEIQDHGFQEDRVVNTGIVKIAERLKIKIVATNDSHFISCRDVEAHDALLCINTQKLISEQKRMRYSGTEYLKSAEEMKQLFQDHLENEVIELAISNTLEVADKVEKYEGILGEPRIPDYPIPPDHNADTYLEKLSWDGLLERLKLKQRSEIYPVYKERMETELKVLQDKGFSTYFLVVWDYIKHARDNNIPVGPGRGSAAGSLVAYSLRITNIDPVHHGLLFERFLNPERKSMPDIDTDFCIENRDEMIKYVTRRYGEERVAQIITFNRMTSKAVLKDVGRVLGVSFGEANKMAKLIPVARGKPAKLKVMTSDETPSPEFKEAFENQETEIKNNEGVEVGKIPIRQWIDMAIRIEGTNKTFGVHAAGVVISKEPLDEIVPLQRNNDGSVITQYHMEDIESLGLLKMDFLGLKNLTIIQNTANLIEKNRQINLIPDDLPAEERKIMKIFAKGEVKNSAKAKPDSTLEKVKNTYDLIQSGDLEGVFQLESSGMVDVVKKLKPTSIEDISSILALYRPGPLDAGLIPKFIDRKHGREKIEYQDPKLEPILQETYGVLCLPKGTLIDKPDGSRKAIENIKSGEVILTSDGRKVWEAKVAKQWRSGVREILKITLSSGTIIYAGKNHRFLTPEGDKFAWELETGVKNGNIYGSAVYEKWQVSSNKKKTDSWSRKNQDYSQEKATLFKAKNLSDIAQLENWEKSRENYLQISSLSLATHLENFISQTNISTQKNQKFSLSKPTFNLSDIAKLENWEKSRENYLQISSLSLATDSINSISQTNSLSGKNQKYSRQRAILFKPTNFSEKTHLKNGEESNQEICEKTHLQDVRLVYVISVEEAGKAECFDLEMEDQNSPYFLAEGVVVHNCYQEQIMKMAQDLAGYSLGEADLLRRCLSGSTKVIDAATGNLVSLKEIAAKPEYWLSRKVFSLDIKSQQIVQKPITEIHPNGVRDIWEITTRTNRKIRATNDHLFYTVLGWKPLKNFELGDHLGLPKKIPINHNSQISDAQIKLTAYLIGDGHLSTKSPSCSYFCNSDVELITDFNRCAEKLFGSSAPIDQQLHQGKKSVTYVRIGFLSAFNNWVDNHLKRANSRDKEIPNWVFYLSKSQLQLFLGILWSTDGSFDKRIGHTDYNSTSEVLVRQIQHLLLRLGIVSLFNIKKIKYLGEPYVSYRVQITGREDMLKFCELIQPYLSSYKQELCQSCYLVIKNKQKNQSKHCLPPEIITIIAQAKKASGMTWKEIDKAVGVCRGTMSSGLNFQNTPTRSLSRHKVNNFATAFADEELRAIANSEVFWDEITSIEYIGKEEVFDLTISETHNFIANDFIVHNCMGKKKVSEMEKHREIFIDGATQRGVLSAVAQDLFEQMIKFAEYCFNKSHSTAYAYVAYQTAYLKANYPVEYMAALLTANSGDQDKVQKYIANCQKFNIEVEPPNINKSEVDFTPLPKVATGETKDKILFGLSAVKNVGEGAIEAILKARKEGGEFKSLADLCDRVNLNALNSRTLESLIKCGAFDKIQPNRHQLIKDLEGVMKWAQDRNKDRDIGQLNLFDVAETTMPAFDSAPKSSPVSDFPAKEKLQYEKEILGFYVSDHPLKYAQEQNQIKDVVTIAQMSEKKSKSAIKLVVMLAGIKHHITKKGDPMAFLQVEDMTGQVDAVVFPKIYEEIKDLLTENALLVLTGKVDKKDDESQLLVDSAEAVEKVMADAVEQDEKPLTELDNYQNESINEEIEIHQSIAEVEKPVEQLEIQKNTPKKDAELFITENRSAKQRQIIILQLPVHKIPEDNSLFEHIKAILKEQSSGDEEKAKVAIRALISDEKQQQLVEFSREFWVEDGETTINTINSFKAIGLEAEIINY